MSDLDPHFDKSIVEIVDLQAIERIARQRQHTIDIYRDNLKRYLKHMSDDAEKAQDYMRRLIREGAPIDDELSEMLQAGCALQIVAGTMRMAMERNQSEAAE